MRKCCNHDVFDLENIYLGSPNLHLEEFLYGPTYPPNFVFLALTGAEIAGGGQILPPPPPGCVILRPSTGSALSDVTQLILFNIEELFFLCNLVGYALTASWPGTGFFVVCTTTFPGRIHNTTIHYTMQ